MGIQTAIHVGNFSWPGGPEAIAPTIADLGRAAEDAGVAYVSFMDHFFQIPPIGPATEPMLEGYTALAFLAAHTSTVTLQLLCTGVTYRHPGLLAKTVTTLDVLSGGRAALGIGAAWFDREHLGLGVPFPPVAERFERLEETVQICLQMWSGEDGPFIGKHYRLEETLCVPQPISRPRPPIMIAGRRGEEDPAPRRAVRRPVQHRRLPGRDRGEARHPARALRDRGPGLRGHRRHGHVGGRPVRRPEGVSDDDEGLRGARRRGRRPHPARATPSSSPAGWVPRSSRCCRGCSCVRHSAV